MSEIYDVTVACDDTAISSLLRLELTRIGYSVSLDGSECTVLIFDADADLNYPERVHHSFSVAFTRDTDTVRGISCDAVIRRPVSFPELRVTVGELIARFERSKLDDPYEFKLVYDKKAVIASGVMVSLTPNEFSLLELLISNKGCPVTRDSIKKRIGGDGNTPEVYVCSLRKKLTFDGKCPISTVRGVGYTLK